eukprot:Skav208692  [mRNA]  locus=scaffold42:130882:132582:+ [translate_table: standard]
MKRDYDHLFKLLLIGDSGAGKSCLLLRLIQDTFTFCPDVTVGVEFGIKTIPVDKKTVKLQIWDSGVTCPQMQLHRTFLSPHYRTADGIILVYDICNRKSFEHVDEWLSEANSCVNQNTCKILIGNKCDCTADRHVSTEEAKKKAEDLGIAFIECSAKDATNVEAAFQLMSTELLAKIEKQRPGTQPPQDVVYPAGYLAAAAESATPSTLPAGYPAAAAESATPSTATLSTLPAGYPAAAAESATPSTLPAGYPAAAAESATPSTLPAGYPAAAAESATLSTLPAGYPAAAAESATPSTLPAGYPAAAAESPTLSPVARTFASSAFKELYNQCQLSKGYRILHFVRDYMNWLQAEGFGDDVADEINQKLEKKILEGFTVVQLAIFTWTLMERVHDRELCSYMNEILREDSKERLQPLIPLVRAMNSFLVTRGKAASEWPKDNITYRGAGIPDEHMAFFQSGVQYRCPMFLATSFDDEVAEDFARMNRKGKNMVIFHVHYDVDLRCSHVNYLKGGGDVENEAEFLFPPYSAFTVKLAPEKDGKKWVIHIEAFPDNCEAPEDLPLSLWH